MPRGDEMNEELRFSDRDDDSDDPDLQDLVPVGAGSPRPESGFCHTLEVGLVAVGTARKERYIGEGEPQGSHRGAACGAGSLVAVELPSDAVDSADPSRTLVGGFGDAAFAKCGARQCRRGGHSVPPGLD